MALTSTWQQDDTSGRHGLAAVLVVGLLAALLLVLAVMFLWPQTPDGPQVELVNAGPVDDFTIGQPKYFGALPIPLWVVRVEENVFVALSATDPRFDRCRVFWFPQQ